MIPGLGRSPGEGNRLPTPVFLGFPFGSAGKESACNVGDLGSIPGSGRSPWRRERLLTPVFWPGEFHGLYSPWGLQRVGYDFSFHFSLSGGGEERQETAEKDRLGVVPEVELISLLKPGLGG